MITERKAKFLRLLAAANEQTTDWLVANVKDCGAHATPLSILACLRVICARTNTSGRPYRERMLQTKSQLRAQQ